MQPRRLIAIVSGLALAVVGGRAVHAAGKADHLICYKMADKVATAAVDMIADLQPEFTQRDCRLLKPIEFCVPATKQNITPQPGTPDLVGQPLRQDYICYLAKCAVGLLPPAKRVADQFGARIEQKYKPTKICVPAAKLPIRCGDSGAPRCGGVCPAGEICKVSAASSQCTCLPQPCGGQPDKGGTCGGTCTDPSQICQLSTSTTGKLTCGCGQVPPPPCGTNPLTGSCGGICTDPTQTCQVDASGNCGCGPIPPPQPCGLNSDNVCGGPCANPGDLCVPSTLPGQPCTCVPPPCHQDPVTGACSGTCAAGTAPGICHLSGNECVCGPPPCSIDPASGQCGGVCPNGVLCAPDANNNCGCQQPCGTDPLTGSCGGGCPPNTTCRVQGTECRCTTPPPCNFGAETPNFCSGFCPAGQVCRTTQVTTSTGKTTLSCVCLNN